MAGAVQRYCGGDGEPRVPHAEGVFVLFADVEEALRDSTRLAWLRPVIDKDDGDDGLLSEVRTKALARGIAAGMTGNALVDWAMQEYPA